MAKKYLKYDWLFTEMNRGNAFINGTLLKAYKDQKEWKGDREFVERLSNDREIMLAVANSIVLTPEQKEFFFGYMSHALNGDKDFLIKVMVATNVAEKNRAKETKKLEKINVNKKYLTKEVIEDLAGRNTNEFTLYSAGLDAKFFEDIITKDSAQLVRIAIENKENPKFVKALIEALVKSDEEVFKLPEVLESNLEYCEEFLADEKYVKTLKANIKEQAHLRINKLNEDFEKQTLEFRNKSEKNAKTYYNFFTLLDEIKTNKIELESQTLHLKKLNNELALLTDNKEKKAKQKEITAQEKEINKIKNQIKKSEEKINKKNFEALNKMRNETIEQGNEIAEAYTKLALSINPVVEKAIASVNKKKADKELEEETQRKAREKVQQYKQNQKEKEKADKDRRARKGVVVANYLNDQMKGNMTALDEATK